MAKLQLVRDTGRHLKNEPREWSRPQYDDYDPSDLVAQLRGELEEDYSDYRRDRRGDYRQPPDNRYDDHYPEPPPAYRPGPPPGYREDYRRDAGHRPPPRKPYPERPHADYGYDDRYPEPPRPRRDDPPYDAYAPPDPRVDPGRSAIGSEQPRRSVGKRLAAVALTGLVFIALAAAAYLAIVGGVLDSVLARSDDASPSADSAETRALAASQADQVDPVSSQIDALQLAAQPAAPVAAEAAQPTAPAVAPAASAAVASQPAVPDIPGLAILIRNALVGLQQANITGNYAVFRENAAPGLQEASTAASLSDAFADLRTRDLDLDEILVANPTLRSAPVINDEGLLRLTGVFPIGEAAVDFELVFQSVDGRWRLFGIGIRPPDGDGAASGSEGKQTAGVVPDSPALVKLIRGAMIALNQANRAGDYSVLQDIGSPGFQDANSPAQLSAHFAELRARDLDLSPVAVIDPRLFRPPSIDGNGYLRLTGFFPSEPEQVNFDLAFQFVGGDWRLFGIGVNTSRQVPQTAAASPGDTAPATPGNAEAGPPTLTAPAVAGPPTPRLRPLPNDQGVLGVNQSQPLTLQVQ